RSGSCRPRSTSRKTGSFWTAPCPSTGAPSRTTACGPRRRRRTRRPPCCGGRRRRAAAPRGRPRAPWRSWGAPRRAREAGWLERVLAAADPDPWRQAVRAARARNDRPALEQLAREVDAAAQPPEELFLLDLSLRQRGAHEGAVALLRRAQGAFPGDFWI